MELKDFVKTALLDIVNGAQEAQNEMTGLQAVGSSNKNKFERLPSGVSQDQLGAIYSVVNFDVAVTTADEARGQGGISVFSIGAKGEVSGRAETISRIQFSTTLRLS